MPTRHRGSAAIALVALVFAACGGNGGETPDAQPAAEEPQKVSFTLDFIPSGTHTFWYVAKEKGYYEEEGLDVEINAGQSAASALATVISGRAQFAHSDFPSLTLAQVDDADMNAAMVMATYARAPYAIYSLESEGNITSVEDLAGKTIRYPSTSSIAKITQAWATEQGAGTIDFKPTNATLLEEVLLEGKADGMLNFTTSRPGLEQLAADQGDKLVTLELAEAGLDQFHGTGVIIDKTWGEENPELVEGFIRASVRGLEYTFANPQEAAEIMQDEFPTVTVESTLDRLVELEILVTDDGAVTEIGTIDPEKAESSVALIVKGLDLPSVEATDLYVDTYR